MVATQLGDVRLTFDGIPAPLLYVAGGQVLGIVPYGIAGNATTSIQVERGASRSQAITMNVAGSWPGIFTAASTGSGQAAMFNQDYSLNGTARRAAHNSIVTLFATGAGVLAPAPRDGQISGLQLSSPLLPATAKIGGIDAEVLYAGSAPGLVSGVLQVNIRVPAQAPAGDAIPLELNIGGRVSQTARQGFDLAQDIPLRARLFQIAPEAHVLLLVLHHIAADGASLPVLARDFAAAYAARRAGTPPSWAPLAVQYADYTLWQREALGAETDPNSRAAEQIAF